VLLWIYYSAQIFLLGAEFTKIHTRRRSPYRRRPWQNGGARSASNSAMGGDRV
jgi:uncharacterized BrkB/YihY/UPF0761 family membrane protein